MQHSQAPCPVLGLQALVICISLPHLSLAVTIIIYPSLRETWSHLTQFPKQA